MVHHLRQYMPNKPHKWGMKLFVLCDSSGFAYRFEVYNGAGGNKLVDGHPNLGASANVVMRLSQTILDMANHIVYFDNFYTSLPLLVYLRARGIFSLGTIRVNRVPGCKLSLETAIKDKPRGYSEEYVASSYGVDLTTVLWKDNKVVHLASTYVGVKPFQTSLTNPTKQPRKASRFVRKQGRIDIDCPEIISEYNKHMGGVDLMDGLMGRYHIRAKTRDAATRLLYHFIDMAATNAYILYRRIHREKVHDSPDENDPSEKLLTLPQFRKNIAAGLVNYNFKRQAGRPSSRLASSDSRPSTPEVIPGSFPVGRRAVHPVDDTRFDCMDHWPQWTEKRVTSKRCAQNKTKALTMCICSKCNIALCCFKGKNCFVEYHNKK
ncbi:piggyBac transposable element-derived protein 1-like [Ctenocephalides felis]|uniref:piggyBac transposable element-derived protein 1-like n=1 Tax=Ctenocephalides felis TaxID=7515 RepID=UPI000E6E49CC|nr:piggyBac transposable element-derived protein 1-like [Ctenocephalides felis]